VKTIIFVKTKNVKLGQLLIYSGQHYRRQILSLAKSYHLLLSLETCAIIEQLSDRFTGSHIEVEDHLSPDTRQQIVNHVLDATTLYEIEAATRALDEWLATHPDDTGLEDGYEQLALMKSAVLAMENIQAEPVAVN
jgi:hypothetical protein